MLSVVGVGPVVSYERCRFGTLRTCQFWLVGLEAVLLGRPTCSRLNHVSNDDSIFEAVELKCSSSRIQFL